MRIAGAFALVTGGLSGLGRAVVQRLADRQAHVVVLDLPVDGPVDLPVGVIHVPGDVADEDAVQSAVDRAAGLGDLRIVVNCAGVAPAIRTFGRNGPHPLADFERAIRTNLVGTFNVVRLAVPAIAAVSAVAGERGVVVNTASVAAFDGQIGQAAYAASKGGVVAMTLPLARDLAGHLIRVVTIAPGIFDTPLLAALPEPARESLATQVPHPARLGRPEEFAALVQHILENPMLNGETIRLDGAIRMAPR
jgi:NAD(P)-dependent dehydrogenase (short-subunit alcohol dehydrogenase family)